MIYRIYPNKDATIYEEKTRKAQNTGKDEILEIGKFYDIDNTSLLGNSRALIQFKLKELSDYVSAGTITSPQYRLRLENVENSAIQSDYDLYVYPLKESWEEGLGQFLDEPKLEDSVTWTHRLSGSLWDVTNSTVGKPLDEALISGLDAYYDFAGNAGGFELVEQINGTQGEVPTLFVSDGKLIMSASSFSGGTANLSASLEDNKVYNVHFDFNRGTLSGVDFNIINPSGSRLNDEISNYRESIVSTGAYKVGFTSSMAGQYKIQYTFFDNNGDDGSAGNIDNFLLFATTDPNVQVFDQFTVDSTELPSTYVLNEPLVGGAGSFATGSAVIGNGKMNLNANNFGGATLNRKYNLQSGAGYTASFDLEPGNYKTTYADSSAQGIEFSVQDPDGRLVDVNDMTGYVKNITSSLSPNVSFSARQDGEYLFRWTFFASGSYYASASLDNFKVQSSNVSTSSVYTDTQYDANWSVNQGGGTWFTASFNNGVHYKQSFDKYTDNLDVNVTQYVNEWIDGTRTNNGFIIKKANDDEASKVKFGSIKFFSSDTHTIYPPVLETRWDDSTFVTGSLEALTGDDIILYVKNLKTEYKETSKGKVRVFGRDRYPNRSFASNPIKSVKYLPSTSYYSVVDAETDQVIIPFDTNYTKLSCDTSGNYFNFWFNGLQPERFYKFCFRVDQNGTTRYYDDNFYFKVVR